MITTKRILNPFIVIISIYWNIIIKRKNNIYIYLLKKIKLIKNIYTISFFLLKKSQKQIFYVFNIFWDVIIEFGYLPNFFVKHINVLIICNIYQIYYIYNIY